MILALDFSSDVPIYMQIRNQIVMGISEGKLAPGDKLPTIRNLAAESGINSMTVNKAYQLLKQENFITTDRRSGAVVNDISQGGNGISKVLEDKLRLLISEMHLSGVTKDDFVNKCRELFEEGR
jgi:DNA-binding transcriptional regulator YhcF (GntR family)